jgi:hypothetical protein
MKVKELIKLLQQHDPEAEVISSAVDSGGYDSIWTTVIEVFPTLYKHDDGPVKPYLYCGGKDE